MNHWKPITDSEFAELFRIQYAELNEAQRNTFNQFRGPFWKATIRRSEMYGDETVFVVSREEDGVLYFYFDDAEEGFTMSIVDTTGRILELGGSQNILKEAIDQPFLP